MNYQTRLVKSVTGGGSGDWFRVELHAAVVLPFPPYPGLRVGLEPDSDEWFDGHKIVAVVWNVPRGTFVAESDPGQFGDAKSAKDAAVGLSKDGWELHVGWGDRFGDAESALDTLEEPGQVAVGIDGYWFAGDQSHVWFLRERGIPHEVAERTGGVPR